MPAISVIPTLPAAPSRYEIDTFEERSDAFLSALPAWNSALNSFGAQISTAASAVEAARLGAESARDVAISQGSATLYSGATAYDAPDVVIGSNGQAYRCLSTSPITGDNPVTSTSGYWVPLATPRYAYYYVDTVSGADSNSGLALTKAFQTLDKALSMVTGVNSINATIYLASDCADFTLTSRRTLYGTTLAIYKVNPPGGRTPGIPTITQASTIDGSGFMPGFALIGANVSTNCHLLTAESIPQGANTLYRAVAVTHLYASGMSGLSVGGTGVTTTLRAADLAMANSGMLSLSLSGTLARPTGTAKMLKLLYGSGQVSIQSVIRSTKLAWSTYLDGVKLSSTGVVTNLLLNDSLTG